MHVRPSPQSPRLNFFLFLNTHTQLDSHLLYLAMVGVLSFQSFAINARTDPL